MSNWLEALTIKLGMDTSGVKTGVGQTKSMLGGLKDAAGLGSAAVGAGIGAFAADGINKMVAFDDQMRQVFAIMPGISGKAMEDMKSQVRGMATEFGLRTDDLAAGLATAIGSGIPEDNVFEFIEVASKAGIAGASDTDTAVKALAATLNAYNMDVSETSKVSDLFFNAIDKGVTTFPELSASMANVSPVAASMGIGLDEVLAAITQMTLIGVPTSEAITNIVGSLTALQRTTPEMEQALKNLGYETGQAMIDALGYQGSMEALRAEADRMGVPLIKLTGRLQGQNAILGLTGTNMESAREVLGTFPEATGAVERAFGTMNDGVGGSVRKVQAFMQDLSISIGGALEPVAPLMMAFGPTITRVGGAAIGGALGLVGKMGGNKLMGALSGVLKAGAGKVWDVFAGALSGASEAVGGALTKVMAKVGLEGAASSLATKFMGAFAAALPLLGVAAAGVAIGAAIGKMIVGPAVDAATAEMQAKANAALEAAHGNDAELARQQAVLEQGLKDFHSQFGADLLFGDNGRKLQDQLDAVIAARKTLAEAPPGMGDVAETLEQELQRIAAAGGAGLEAIAGAYGTTGGEIQGMLEAGMDLMTQDMLDEMRSGSKEWQDGIIAQMGLTPANEAELRAKLAESGERVAKGTRTAWRKAFESGRGTKAFGGIDFQAVEGVVDGAGKRIAGGTNKLRAALRSGLQGAAQTADAGMQAIQSAMAKPPKLMSMGKRLKQFERAAKTAWRNMKRAVAANDPVNAAYWEQQYINVRDGQRSLRQSSTKTMGDIRRDMTTAGYKVIGETKKTRKGVSDAAAGMKKDATASSEGLKDGMTADMAANKVAVGAAAGETASTVVSNLAPLGAKAGAWGSNITSRLAAGMRAQNGVLAGAAAEQAAIIHGYLGFSAPPKHGALASIREWGPHMVKTWVGTMPVKDAEDVGKRLGDAITPRPGTPRWRNAGAGRVDGRGGGDTHIHVGTMIANDAGIDQLHRRMSKRERIRKRDRRRGHDTATADTR